MTLKGKFKSRIRGWFPQEPTIKTRYTVNKKLLTKIEFDKKLFKTSLIANVVMLNIFLGTNFFLIQPRYASLEVSILQWGVYISAVLAVNALIYRHYKRRLLGVGDN
jgi:hypothetical protein